MEYKGEGIDRARPHALQTVLHLKKKEFLRSSFNFFRIPLTGSQFMA